VRATIAGWQDQHQFDLQALCSHLLPSRSPYAADWKRALLLLPDTTRCFISKPVEGVQHVFTDGTATAATLPTKLAAWGCLNATSGEVVAMGHDPGLSQLSDRAELLAALSAIDGQVHFGVSMHMWTDSKYVADGISHILQSGVIGDRSNQDIWERVHQLLHQLGQLELVPHWVPSHLDANKLQDPFEDWVRCWNDRIDFAIGQYNFCRPREFLQLRDDTNLHFEQSAARMRQLQAFYFKVAANGSEVPTEPPESTVWFC